MLDKDERKQLLDKLSEDTAVALLRTEVILRAVEFGAKLAQPPVYKAQETHGQLDMTVDEMQRLWNYGKMDAGAQRRIKELEGEVEALRLALDQTPEWRVPLHGQTLRVTKPKPEDFPGIPVASHEIWPDGTTMDVKVTGFGGIFDTNNKMHACVYVVFPRANATKEDAEYTWTIFIPIDHLNNMAKEAQRGH